MLRWIIDAALRHRFVVFAGALALAVAGALSLRQLPIDAFPDTTPVQVQINTVAPALGPEEIERQITFPIEQVLAGIPLIRRQAGIRSISKFGMSQVVVTFEDGTDVYFARQLVHERLSAAQLPPGIERPTLGPVSTALGEVLHYIVRLKDADLESLPEPQRIEKLTYLNTLHRWVIRPKLLSVPGVAEVNTWGGYEKQYQVRIDPQRLIRHGLTFQQVVEALQQNNQNVGGGSIRQSGQMLLVHGVARTVNLEQIRNIVITAHDGVPIRVRDVADVETGHEIRRGAVTADGRGEVVLGLGFMLMGENPHTVTRQLKSKLDEIRRSLPPDVELLTVYDRTELVDQVIETVRSNLFEGGLLVIAVLFAFLGNLRAAMIVALAIPLSMLFAFSGMLRFGIAASLLSLGAIDFGLVVDSSVVMVENCVRYMAHSKDTPRTRMELVRQAAMEVRQPTMFAEMIIILVYLPILTLEGVEGKLFRPMALTVIFALLGSMILSLTLIPVLASMWLPRRVDEDTPLVMRWICSVYLPMLNFCMTHKVIVVASVACVLVVALGQIAPRLGAEFVPRLSEGALAINVVRLAGTDIEESIRVNTQMERLLREKFPDEVRHVWSRIGTAEVATDPMGVELTDIFVSLHPRQRWTKARTQAELVTQMEHELRQIPGQRIAFSQPIEMRLNEMIAGSRADVVVKLFGDDFQQLIPTAQEIQRVLTSIDGSADVQVEQVTGQPILQIRVDQDQLARYGVPASTVLDLVASLGSKPVGDVVEGQLRFPLVVRLPEKYRTGPAAVGTLMVATPTGEHIPLARLASIQMVEGPSTITREWGQRRITITCNVRGRDTIRFVREAQRKVAQQITLPPGRYFIEWDGQFEHYENARRRLMLIIPFVAVLVFSLLFLTYGNVIDALRVLTGAPLGWVGGVLALWLRDMPFSISAAIGFIVLSGLAIMDDMILVSYIRQLRRRGLPVDDAVRTAAITRLRPVLMTSLVASLGFVPMAVSTGVGAEVQRPLATVVIGGVMSATIMSLLVIRVVYTIVDQLAGVMVWILTSCCGWAPHDLAWLVGEHVGDQPPCNDETTHTPAIVPQTKTPAQVSSEQGAADGCPPIRS